MARTNLEEKKLTLEEMIPLYGEQNTECNALKKVVADLNSKIKEQIKKEKKENKDIVIDGWTCNLEVKDDSDFNEERLVEFCKLHKIDVVRTKEYVDGKALENLIYNGQVSRELLLEMNKCKDKKMKETLRCKKVSKKKEED